MTVLSAAIAYSGVAAIMTIIPGPDTAVVLSSAIRGGRAAAVRAALGVGSGLLVWGLAASIGLSAALHSSTEVYTVFRFACGAYLIYLGISLLLRRTPVPAQTEGAGPASRTFARGSSWGYRRALTTSVFNPKLGVFFVTVMPIFIPAHESVAAISFLFASIQGCEAVAWYLVVGAVAARAQAFLRREEVIRWLDWASALVFLPLGALVALERS